jgi:CrcB protein
MNRILLIIGTGGFIGSIARALTQQVVSKYFTLIFPIGTLSINVIGSLFIGIIYALAERGNISTPEWRAFLATGFCGGFTTFSAFSLESVNLMKDGEVLYLALYVGASVVLGIAATYFGTIIIKSV